jgi:hypothetical protein
LAFPSNGQVIIKGKHDQEEIWRLMPDLLAKETELLQTIDGTKIKAQKQNMCDSNQEGNCEGEILLLLKQKMKKFNPQSTQDKCP